MKAYKGMDKNMQCLGYQYEIGQTYIYDEWDGEKYPIKAVKAAIVDGVTIKANTPYTLKDGEFVEVT